jgi:hypothetical protein
MKIVGISQQHHQSGWLTFVVDPPIAPEIARHFRRIYSTRSAELNGIEVEPFNGMLRVHATHVPKGTNTFLDKLLAEAEGFVAHEQDFARQKQHLAASQKDESLRRASDDLGLPLM